MYLGIEPIPLRGGEEMVGVYKIKSAIVFTSLGASIRWLSITTSFQSKVKLLSLSIIPSSTPILFFLSSLRPRLQRVSTPSLRWVIYDGALIIHGHNSVGLVQELRGSFIMTQLISRWSAGGIRGCVEASVGSVDNHNTETYT